MTSQSNVYDLCVNCKHFRYRHGVEKCCADDWCNCKQFVEMPKSRVEPTVEEQVEEYKVYLQLIREVIETQISNVRVVDKDYEEDVARQVISTLNSNGWVIRKK